MSDIIGRRSFLARGAVAAAAAPLAVSPVMQRRLADAQAGLPDSPLSPPDSWIRSSPSPVEDPIVALARKTWQSTLHGREREFDARLAYRIGAFDPDIACLHSVSPAHKIAMQRKRDNAEIGLLDELRRRLGWIDD